MADTEGPPVEKMEAVAKKLAEFSNSLPEREQAMMDWLVASATARDAEPSDQEGAAFARKVQGFRDTLPEDERPLVDSLVIASRAEEEEVVGHAWVLAWTRYTSPLNAYLDCHSRPGVQSLTLRGLGWTGGFFSCYDYTPLLGEWTPKRL
jgi:hypothetical protein